MDNFDNNLKVKRVNSSNKLVTIIFPPLIDLFVLMQENQVFGKSPVHSNNHTQS